MAARYVLAGKSTRELIGGDRMAQRLESVRLELQDAGFSSGMVKAAAATGLLERALKGLDGTTVNINENINGGARSVDGFSKSARDADGSINQLTGRLRVLGEVAAILGPTLTPLGGVAIAGVGGLANQLGLAAVAGGVLIGSMQGVGDALSAMNKAQLDPTVANLEKAEDALRALSPAARDFANEAFALKPALVALRDLGAESLFPGLTESLDSLERLGPQVGSIMQAVAGALGDIASDSAASLASERWEGFFRFIEEEAPRTISELAATVGDLTHGLAELWMAFEPLNSDFSSWLMDVAAGFDEWATGLSATDGFTEFVSYIRETGPQVAETLGAMFNAIVQLVQASAPLGGPVLAGLEAAANVIGAIADSDLGTPIMAGVTALALLNRTLAVTASLSKASLSTGLFAGVGSLRGGISKQTTGIKADIAAMSDSLVAFGANAEKAGAAAERMKGRLAGIGKSAALIGGVGIAASGAADGIGLTNTATLALAGSLGGPVGVALGASAGFFLDLRSATNAADDEIKAFDASIKGMGLPELNEQLRVLQLELRNGTINPLNGVMEKKDREALEEKIGSTEKQIGLVEEMTAAQERQDRIAVMAYASQVGLNSNLAVWQRRSTEEIKAQAEALESLNKEADETSASFLKFPDSLDKAKVSLSDFLGEMEKNARALANFNSNSLKAARNGLDEGLIASLRKMGTEGALRMEQFASATQGQIERANKAHNSYQRETERSRKVTAQLAGMSPVELKVNAQTTPAMRNIEALEARLRAIKDENVNVVVRQINAGDTQLGPRVNNALGDFKNAHSPQIAPGGAMRVWAEPETGGESYIPHANDHRRPRAKSILEQTATMFGGSVQWFAEGGTTGKKDGKRKSSAGFFAIDNTDSLQAAIDRLTMVSQDQTSALEDATRRTDEWSQRMADVAQATISGFNTGLFDRDSDPWAAGAGGGWMSNLTRDIAGLQERSGLQSQLAGLGLSGDALAALLGQGSNADISSLIGSGQVSQYAALYNQRAALQGSVGQQAGLAAFGQQQAEALAEQKAATALLRETQISMVGLQSQMARNAAALERIDRDLPERTGASVGREVRGAATDGKRDNMARGGRIG